jgi:hypothetical protein
MIYRRENQQLFERTTPMTDEERQRAIDFIVDTQAKNSVQVDKLVESHQAAERRLAITEHRLDRDERILRLMLRAGRRERRSEADERLTNALADLAQSMAHTDSRLDALVDIVRQGRNGGQQAS